MYQRLAITPVIAGLQADVSEAKQNDDAEFDESFKGRETTCPSPASTVVARLLWRTNMRIHYENNFAYDLEQPRDPQTQLPLNWKFTVYELRPVEKVVARGEASTRAEAERKAKSNISRLINKKEKLAA